MRYSEICFFKELTYIKLQYTSKSQYETAMHMDNMCGGVHFSRKSFKYKPFRMS